MKKLIRAGIRHLFALSVVAIASGYAHAKPQEFRDLQIEVVGKGQPVLLIPGLNSGAETWRETCAALQAHKIQCHLVQLPGFAGRPAATDAQHDQFLIDMRDRLLAYVEAKHLKAPIVVGHSLGGVVALEMAIKQPETFAKLVIVDSLPFFPAIQNPALTEEQAKPMAEGMRQRMLSQDAVAYEQSALSAVKGMAHDPARVETLRAWGLASDRTTTGDAMYAMMATDLRPQLTQVKTPTLVLGSWAAYAPYGATKESTTGVFRGQYANLKDVRIELSEGGYHFLMWDDPQWLQAQVRGFIGPAK